MRKLKLAGSVLAACVGVGVAAPHLASAAISLHPSVCVLAQNGAPFGAISGATYANATFTNSSGGTALAYCPMLFENSLPSFQITTTSAGTSCTLQQNSIGGAVNVFFGSHSGNSWTFTPGLNPQYVFQAACPLANGTGIRHIMNF